MSSHLVEVLSRIKSPRIAVVGDCMLDEYLFCKVERISPEAPIPVLRYQRKETRLGGAGNVVSNLAALGAQVTFFSAVGADAGGDRALELLRDLTSARSRILRLAERATTVKTRLIGFVQHADRAQQQMLRLDNEDTSEIPRPELEPLIEALRAAAGDLDALLVSDYKKGLLGVSFLRRIYEVAGGRVPILVDPARTDDYERYRGSLLICPNRYEAELGSGVPCEDVDGCRRAGEKLAAEFDIDYAAVTMDRDGIYLCRAGGGSEHFPTQARTVTDVTGAGDMVLSMLGFIVGGKGAVEDAVRLANVAAGIEIRRMGACPIPRNEILIEMLYQGHSGAAKIKTLEELRPRVEELRAAGKKIVFTNGCFDLLHFGHHQLLNQARQLGDCLIVAVNSDASIARLKGPGRPVFRQHERMLMLSGLESVDYVVLFDDDTPTDLLRALRPDFLVKGSEYRDGVVVGRDVVESYGGTVALVDMVPGISTSAILERRR
jgi:D-beta-D-heptose 7-phosphate kinase/D-beta-D-heptose 1-phosphate adenosyltransferase